MGFKLHPGKPGAMSARFFKVKQTLVLRVLLPLLVSLAFVALLGFAGALIPGRSGAIPLRRRLLWTGIIVALTVAISVGSDGFQISSLGWHLGAAAMGWLAGRMVHDTRRAPGRAFAGGLLIASLAAAVMFFVVTDVTGLADESFLPSRDSRRSLRQLMKGLPKTTSETWDLQLAAEDINALLRSSLAARDLPTTVRIDIQEELTILEASIPVRPLPWMERFANIRADVRAGSTENGVELKLEQLALGGLESPQFLQRRIERMMNRFARENPRIREMDTLIGKAEVRDGRFWFSGTNAPRVRQLVLQGLHGEGPEPVSDEVVKDYVARLIEAGSTLPPGDERFCGLISVAFEHARARSATGDPVAENRAAIVALAVAMGDNSVAIIAGLEPALQRPALPDQFRWKITLRGRLDLAQHFLVSAALTALSSKENAESAGFVKEYLDAQAGGSGFSFADLSADRAGVRFGSQAVRDRGLASQLQTRLGSGVRPDDVLPPLEGLSEGIGAEALLLDFGSYSDERFRAAVAEIDEKITRCPLYQ